MDSQNIEAAASAFNAGNAEAFGTIFDAYSEPIYRYVSYRIENETEREEVVSDVFFRILRHGSLPDGADAVKRWTYSVARSAVIDAYRKRRSHEALENVENSIGTEARFSEDFDNRQTLEKVLEYLNTLHPDHREILVLRIWDDLSYAEIAGIVGKSEDNCKKIVSRGLEAVRSNVAFLFALFLIIR